MSNAAPEVIQQVISDFRPFVLRRAPPHAAEDILQDAFAVAQQAAPQLRDASKLKPWVFSIIRGVIARHLRASKRVLVSDALDPDDRCDEPPNLSTREALGRWSALAITRLPLPYAEALRMVDIEGLTQAEAAARAQISLSGMKSRVQRGRALLRDAILRCCQLDIDARNRVIDCRPQPGSPPCACHSE